MPPQLVSGWDSAATSRVWSCRAGKTPGSRIPPRQDGRGCGSTQGPWPLATSVPGAAAASPFSGSGVAAGLGGDAPSVGPQRGAGPAGGAARPDPPAQAATRSSKQVSNGAGVQPRHGSSRGCLPQGGCTGGTLSSRRGASRAGGDGAGGRPPPGGPSRAGRERRGTEPVPGGAASPALPPPRRGAELSLAEPSRAGLSGTEPSESRRQRGRAQVCAGARRWREVRDTGPWGL